MGDLLIERDRARGCILLPVGAKRRGTRRPRKLASEVVFCFAALRSDVSSP